MSETEDRLETVPLVSVIMGVHNGATHIRQAIESVLTQTSDFGLEIVVVNDASTDDTLEVLKSIDDKRLRIFNLHEQRGLANALNICISRAKGQFLARLDADDVCLPFRLQKQVDWMKDNPDCGVLGASFITFGTHQRYESSLGRFSPDIRGDLLRGCALKHPTVMMRASLFSEHNVRYNSELRTAQDYDLWRQLMPITRMANLGEPVLLYRRHSEQQSNRHQLLQRYTALHVQLKILTQRHQRSRYGMKTVALGYMALIRHTLGWIKVLLRTRGSL